MKYIFTNQDLVLSFMTGSCKLVTNLFPPPRVCPDGQVEIGAAFQINSHRTKQHFRKPLQADPQTKVCKKAVFPPRNYDILKVNLYFYQILKCKKGKQ
ncbi:hypothetical protein [Draconibacterium halophilum]|uniref:Uncharacterized protein n=1 Tax=Draconibacterium halophilum TaxID=2706887 RepID=A0A6C0RFH1_9BACT|nr:hypothetical protein [Draconibacterium halophilum]QIA08817.1 hypothetical protein G0Q07_14290 [Draconibacterium halophilum]